MEKLVASDEKVYIYKIKPIDMLFVFSDIEFKGKTPLLSYKHNYNWDEKRNRPKLISVRSVSAGVGTFFSAKMHAKVRFHSIKNAEIITDVTLNGKVGVEVQLKKSKYEKVSELPLMPDLDVPVPGFGIAFKYNILNLRQPIILSEVQKTAQSGTQTLTVNEPANEISCECTIQRYVPIIRVNCSHENSTHRIITNAYELNSFKPSESKPQVIQVKEGQLYGVFQLKRIDDNVESVIIHMPEMQPLCAFVSFVKKESIVKKEIYWFPELIAMTVFGGIGSALLVVIIILIVILCASHKAGIVCEEP